MKKYILISIVLLFFNTIVAQSDNVKAVRKKEKQIGFNMTGLAAELTPFNAINPFTTGPVTVYWKSFVNNVGYRFGLGVNLVSSGDPNQNLHLNLRNGVEIRKRINDKWNFSYGWDILISFGNLNLPGNSGENSDILFGVAPFWGVEYRISKFVSVSTETSLLVGVSSEGINNGGPRIHIQFIPPIGLFLNLKY